MWVVAWAGVVLGFWDVGGEGVVCFLDEVVGEVFVEGAGRLVFMTGVLFLYLGHVLLGAVFQGKASDGCFNFACLLMTIYFFL